MATTAGNWHPGIGDPSVGGWITVVVYAAAVLLTWRAARVASSPARSLFWTGLAILLLLLGVNKQLDLQTALTEFGKSLALSQGWYEQRRYVQAGFIGALALAMAALLAMVLGRLRSATRAQQLGLVGMAMLALFVLVRAASFHHIDEFLGETAAGLRWNWILEIGALLIIIAAAVWTLRRPAMR